MPAVLCGFCPAFLERLISQRLKHLTYQKTRLWKHKNASLFLDWRKAHSALLEGRWYLWLEEISRRSSGVSWTPSYPCCKASKKPLAGTRGSRRPRIKTGRRHMSPSLHWSLFPKGPQDQNSKVQLKGFFPHTMFYYLMFCSIRSVYITLFTSMECLIFFSQSLTLQSVSKYIPHHAPNTQNQRRKKNQEIREAENLYHLIVLEGRTDVLFIKPHV